MIVKAAVFCASGVLLMICSSELDLSDQRVFSVVSFFAGFAECCFGLWTLFNQVFT
jgi:hypothetical protein